MLIVYLHVNDIVVNQDLVILRYHAYSEGIKRALSPTMSIIYPYGW